MANNDLAQAEDSAGWDWFDAPGAANPENLEAERQLSLAFARCFQDRNGDRVLAYLKATTTERVLGPGAPDNVLRHLEGQRQLVAHISALVQRGRDSG